MFTKLHFVISAKLSFGELLCVPKCNLGTRVNPKDRSAIRVRKKPPR